MPHMPSTGVSGVDLYYYGDMAFCFGTYSFGDTIQYKYRVDRGIQVGKDTEYILYLPLYNEVSHLEIGVPEGSSFSFVPQSRSVPLSYMVLQSLKGHALLDPLWLGRILWDESWSYP